MINLKEAIEIKLSPADLEQIVKEYIEANRDYEVKYVSFATEPIEEELDILEFSGATVMAKFKTKNDEG